MTEPSNKNAHHTETNQAAGGVEPRAESFTGRASRHKTRSSVKYADRISSVVITVGGIGTIIAVCLVFVLLLTVVWPMFGSAKITGKNQATLASTPSVTSVDAAEPSSDDLASPAAASELPILSGVDEYQVVAWSLFSSGKLLAYRLSTGQQVLERQLIDDGVSIDAVSVVLTDNHVAIARSDKTLQVGHIRFKTQFLEPETVSPDLAEMQEGDVKISGESVVQAIKGQFRQQSLEVELADAIDLSGQLGDASIERLDHSVTTTGLVLGYTTDAGDLFRTALRERTNFATGQKTIKATTKPLPLELHDGHRPDFVAVPARGDSVLAIWDDGHTQRYDVRAGQPFQLAESLNVLVERGSDAKVTAVEWVIGRETLLVGDSEGECRAWFAVRHRDAETPDAAWLLPIHELPSGDAAVTTFGGSQRSRQVAIGYENGFVQVVQVTTEGSVIETEFLSGQPVRQLLCSPKDDGLIAITETQIVSASFDPGYPEATFKSLFQPVWYEGYEEPDLVWQSSFAGVKSEMKLGLVPLIFGTIKATVYSMLFGVPIALLAAIYTSEFLAPSMRTKIKALIEMMASLPSVVLGFIGGLVIAPVVEQFVPAVICSVVTIPICCLIGAYLWQQLPSRISLRLASSRLWFVLIALVLGMLAAWRTGPLAESAFFAGDISMWLDQQRGTGMGAWLFLLLPISVLLTSVIVLLFVNPWLAEKSQAWSRPAFARANFLKFAAAIVFAFVAALITAQLLATFAWDPRGSYVGTYVQRNALVVGFVMGFAIVPIVYTIAEDSLSTVPSHLRSASLGAGATPLQTAMRVVIPTAMSGLFSAVMIGLGRAVGETMIVLMAAGNTPLMDWNVFNGFRTLSANIAVELPEAVRDSTHYRTLFLAALTLLFLTFVINTVAEWVRLRFRKRAVQL